MQVRRHCYPADWFPPEQDVLSDRPYPTIQAVEESESTMYVLRRPGHVALWAHWPSHLLHVCPEAIRIGVQSLSARWVH
jgi:hypothetical protein